MYFHQFYLGCLAHASYLIGSEGEAAVVDPQRDIDIYLEDAKAHGLTIRHVLETHLHADFVSGHHELAARTGAQIYVGARAGATFPHVAVHEADETKFGPSRLRFLKTPAHPLDTTPILLPTTHRPPKLSPRCGPWPLSPFCARSERVRWSSRPVHRRNSARGTSRVLFISPFLANLPQGPAPSPASRLAASWLPGIRSARPKPACAWRVWESSALLAISMGASRLGSARIARSST